MIGIAITPPVAGICFEKHDAKSKRTALVRLIFGTGPQNGPFQATYDTLFFPDPTRDASNATVLADADDHDEFIVEGPKDTIKARVKSTPGCYKTSQRKTDAGVMCRISASDRHIPSVCSSAVTWSKVGIQYSSGLTSAERNL